MEGSPAAESSDIVAEILAAAVAQSATAPVETPTVALPPRVVKVAKVDAVKVETAKPEAANLETANLEMANPETANLEAARLETARAVAAETAKAHLARAANPAPVTRRPIVVSAPPPPQRQSRIPMTIAAAAVIVLAIGAAGGARRLGYQWPSLEPVPEGQPVQATPAVDRSPRAARVEGATAAEHRPTPPVVPAEVTPTKTLAPVPPAKANVVAAKRAPVNARARPVARSTAKTPNASVQKPMPVAALAPAPETTAPALAKAPAVVVAESPRTSEPPTGRFFERTDVDEAPRIVTRVAPRLPANLPARASNAVVVVRVLVSRTGQPFQVTLLRGSMLGRAADDAVIAAMTQWTFAPATKRGEPVNCWYNIGVPLSQAD